MSQFLHLLHGWINVCNEICLFGSNSNVEVDVHELVVHVRLGISISFDDSFIASAETKGLDWETHDVHEGKALPSWASPLPIFLCSEFQRISQRIFWLVCSDHASAVSALARCFQRSLLLGFCGISALSLIQSWCVVGEKEHGKETCMFLQHFFFVISMWSWLGSEWWSFGFAIGSNCIGMWSGTFVAMHGLWCDAIVLPVSIDWCDLFRQCVHVQAGFDRSSMDRLGCGFSITLWIPANFLSLPKSRWWVLFWNSVLFIKIRKQPHVVPTDCFRRTGVLTHIVTVKSVWFGSWVRHDFCDPLICYVGISISSSRENHTSQM